MDDTTEGATRQCGDASFTANAARTWPATASMVTSSTIRSSSSPFAFIGVVLDRRGRERPSFREVSLFNLALCGQWFRTWCWRVGCLAGRRLGRAPAGSR
jgi:hypothetical protein